MEINYFHRPNSETFENNYIFADYENTIIIKLLKTAVKFIKSKVLVCTLIFGIFYLCGLLIDFLLL